MNQVSQTNDVYALRHLNHEQIAFYLDQMVKQKQQHLSTSPNKSLLRLSATPHGDKREFFFNDTAPHGVLSLNLNQHFTRANHRVFS
jgi:hypothetical protein